MRKTFLYTMISMGIACNFKSKENPDINIINTESIVVIKLNQVVDDDFVFDKINYVEFPVYSYKYKYPKLYKSFVSTMKGVPSQIVDSFFIVSKSMQPEEFATDLKNAQRASVNELNSNNLIGNVNTNNQESNIRNEYWLHAISGSSNGYHYVILDSNNNMDFSDEIILQYDENLKYDQYIDSVVEDFPILSFQYKFYRDSTFVVNRKIQLYPVINHSYSYLLNDGTLDSLTNNYTIMLRFKDYGKAGVCFFGIDYSVAVQGFHPEYMKIIIKPDSLEYEKNDLNFQENFSYTLNDTVDFSGRYYVINNLIPDFTSIDFKKVDVKNGLHGYRLGSTIKNYELTLINEYAKKSISEIIKSTNKTYLLLDFWGTWCAPCRELTPELNRIYHEYSDNLNILSIALDDDVKDVEKYIAENGMGWTHAIVDRFNRKGSIIDNLNINSYPTFILLD